MADTSIPQEWLTSGALAPPRADAPSTVDLIRILARRCGASEIDIAPHAADLASAIGAYRHYVFVLVDGMGSELLAESAGCGFLKEHVACSISSVFPSTTAAALTTLATARWPGAHGALGWWMYLPGRDVSVTTLPFVERFTSRPLGEVGVEPDEVFTCAGMLGSLQHLPASLLPAQHADSAYSIYASAGTERIGYESIEEALSSTAARVRDSSVPTFTYVYLPHFDAMCHDNGTRHEKATSTLVAIGEALEGLRSRLPDDARMVVSADHGLVDIAKDDTIVLHERDPLLALLRCPPTGEARVPIFHAKEGAADEFRDAFDERFGSQFALVAPDEAERSGLFGPPPYTDVARARLGDWIGITPRASCLRYRPSGGGEESMVGYHGGLSAREMTVPVVVC